MLRGLLQVRRRWPGGDQSAPHKLRTGLLRDLVHLEADREDPPVLVESRDDAPARVADDGAAAAVPQAFEVRGVEARVCGENGKT